MAAKLLAIGPRPVVLTEGGDLVFVTGRGQSATVPVGAAGPSGPSLPARQSYAVYVLAAKYDYAPAFGPDGGFGVALPDDWRDYWETPPVRVRRTHLASGDPVAVPEDGPPPIPADAVPDWFTSWVDAHAQAPPGWYEDPHA